MTDAKQLNRDTRIKPRFKIRVQAKIRAQLIGSDSRFDFVTENISESGLLVTHPANVKHGFNPHTILEVWIRNERNEEIFFFAKFVRRATDTSFAITISDIDAVNGEMFQDFIFRHIDTDEGEGDGQS